MDDGWNLPTSSGISSVGNMGLPAPLTRCLNALADFGLILKLCYIREPNQTRVVLHQGSVDKQDTQPSSFFFFAASRRSYATLNCADQGVQNRPNPSHILSLSHPRKLWHACLAQCQAPKRAHVGYQRQQNMYLRTRIPGFQNTAMMPSSK